MTFIDFSIVVILFIFFVILSAISSAIEISIISVSRLRARALFKQKKQGAESLIRLKENQRRLLIAISIWNNTSSVAAASFATIFFTDLLGANGIGASVLLVTVILVFFGDIGPKLSVSSNLESSALFLSPYVEVLLKFTNPIIFPIEHVAKHLSRKQSESYARKPLISQEELDSILSVAVDEGTIAANEAKLFRDALKFNDEIVEKVMTPIKEVESINSELTIQQALNQSSTSRHHRFPVIDFNGSVIGLVHEKLLLDASAKGRGGLPVTAVILSPIFVKKSSSISSIFELFQKRKRKMAIVSDESGIPLGIISLEDIVEELIEELKDIESNQLNSSVSTVKL